MSFNPLLFSNLPYNADTDFVPVSRLFFLVEGLFASSAINVNTVDELKKLAQSKPDGLNYATLGEGSYPDLFRNWLNSQWNTKIVGIPYRGGGPAAQALAANQVQVTRFGVGNFLGLLDAAKVKAVAVSSAQETISSTSGRPRAGRITVRSMLGTSRTICATASRRSNSLPP